jgi:hypothetical protein
MKTLPISTMEGIEGGFNLGQFLYGACQGFTVVTLFANPVGLIKLAAGAGTVGCLFT